MKIVGEVKFIEILYLIFSSKYPTIYLILTKNDILGDITTAAILHLSGSAPPKLQFTSTDFNSYNTVKTGTIVGGDKCDGGRRMKVPTVLPGLGVTLNKEALKSPIFVIE